MMKRTQVVLMTIVILAFAATSIFIYPQADDFHYITRTAEWGYIPSLVYEYMNWTGRYTTILFHYYSPLYWGTLFHYRLFPILLLILIHFSSVFMVRQIFGSKLKPREDQFFGLALTFLCLTSFHTISEGIYWFSSAYTYTFAIVVFNLAFALIWAEKKTTAKYIAAVIIGFILSGTNETSMVLWLYAVGVTGVIYWLQGNKIPKGLIFTFVISLIGALIVMKAPGNAVRASQFPKSHDFVRTISNALLYSFIDPFKFVTIPLIAFTLLNWHRLCELIDMDAWKKHKKYLVLFMMGLFFISFAPSLWGMGRRPNTRTMNVIVHCYILLFFPLVLTFLKGKIQEQAWFRCVVILLLVCWPNYYLAKDYLTGDIQKYADQWKKNMESGGNIYFSKDEAAKSIHFDFLEDNNAEAYRKFMKMHPGFYQ